MSSNIVISLVSVKGDVFTYIRFHWGGREVDDHYDGGIEINDL
jgi:hypothetical protein